MEWLTAWRRRRTAAATPQPLTVCWGAKFARISHAGSVEAHAPPPGHTGVAFRKIGVDIPLE